MSNAVAAENFYCNQLDLELEFAHRAAAKPDPCYVSVTRDTVWLHLPSFSGNGTAGGVANIVVDDVDILHKEFVANAVSIELKPIDQTWGNREMCVKDRDGNDLRFI